MSELFMECVEEELEPWQKQVPQVNLIDDDDDDDEPIFVGVLCKLLYIIHLSPWTRNIICHWVFCGLIII